MSFSRKKKKKRNKKKINLQAMAPSKMSASMKEEGDGGIEKSHPCKLG